MTIINYFIRKLYNFALTFDSYQDSRFKVDEDTVKHQKKKKKKKHRGKRHKRDVRN